MILLYLSCLFVSSVGHFAAKAWIKSAYMIQCCEKVFALFPISYDVAYLSRMFQMIKQMLV